MGYYTRYNLKWTVLDENALRVKHEHETVDGASFCHVCGAALGANDISVAIGEFILGNEQMNYAMDKHGNSVERTKWYEHADDMKEMSLAFPGVLFTLSGEGEDAGDIWKEYYLDGKYQADKAVLRFDGFNKDKLR